jgi:hypothetical protein
MGQGRREKASRFGGFSFTPPNSPSGSNPRSPFPDRPTAPGTVCGGDTGCPDAYLAQHMVACRPVSSARELSGAAGFVDSANGHAVFSLVQSILPRPGPVSVTR